MQTPRVWADSLFWQLIYQCSLAFSEMKSSHFFFSLSGSALWHGWPNDFSLALVWGGSSHDLKFDKWYTMRGWLRCQRLHDLTVNIWIAQQLYCSTSTKIGCSCFRYIISFAKKVKNKQKIFPKRFMFEVNSICLFKYSLIYT